MLMLPDDKQSDELRTLIKNVYVFKNATHVPLAFQKHYFFQIREPWKIHGHIIDWNNYYLESKSCTGCISQAANDLKVIYLSDSMLFAWMHSIRKNEEE